jgi:TolB-like protein
MHALEATGQRAAALQHARIQELLLREQWGLEPDAEVAALAATLRAAPSVAAQIPAIARDELVMSSRPAIVVRKSPHGRLLRRPAAVASIIILLALGVLGAAALVAWLPGRDATDRPLTLQRLVVIPFDEPRDSVFHYLAFGLGDAIATELARFRALIVPSQRSTARYSGTTKPLSQIALELSAAAIVSGSVQRDGDRIRVEVKLFDAKTNQQLWAQRYEHPNTEALEIQRSATQAIVAALRVDLTKAERALLARAPTTNPRAYDLYLRARELELRFEESDDALSENIREAQSLFARARDLDPNFAMARSRLAWLHIFSALKYDPTMGRREQARIEAETALRIHPGLAEAHEALAAYWDVGRKDYEKSIAQLKLAQAGWPNNVDLRLGLANMHARWGRWEEAIAELKRAQQLEPHNSGPALYSAFIYGRLRRYEESIEASDRVIAQKPDDLMHKVYRGYSFLRWQGISDTLAATLRGIPATWDPNGMGTLARYMAARVERHHSEALAVLNASDHDVSFDMYTYRPLTLLRAQTYDALGDHVRARSNYEAARVLLVDSIAAHPEVDLDYSMATPVARMRIALGLAYAGLGRKQEAAVEARRAMELAPLSTNIQSATAAMAGAAEVFTQAGDTNTALRLLELLLGMPAGREISVPLLRKDPAYDPLRGDPRFERLLTRFSTN